MPLVGIQRRAWTATTLPPTLSAAAANSFETVSKIELVMFGKAPFLIPETVKTGSWIGTEDASAGWLGRNQKIG
jgi:hypothetical protein